MKTNTQEAIKFITTTAVLAALYAVFTIVSAVTVFSAVFGTTFSQWIFHVFDLIPAVPLILSVVLRSAYPTVITSSNVKNSIIKLSNFRRYL